MELAGQLVYHGFEGEGALHIAGRTKRAEGAEIREDPIVFRLHVGTSIESARRAGRPSTPGGIRSQIHDRFVINRRQCAIPLGPDLERLDTRGPIARGEILFVSIEQDLHRATRHLRRERGHHRVFPGLIFAAETSAHVLLDDAHFVLGQPQCLGYRIAHPKDVLGGVPEGERIPLPEREAAVGF